MPGLGYGTFENIRICEITGRRAECFQLLIIVVVGIRVCGDETWITAINDVAVQDLSEVTAIAYQADDSRRVIVERCEHCLFFVGPRRSKIFRVTL